MKNSPIEKSAVHGDENGFEAEQYRANMKRLEETKEERNSSCEVVTLPGPLLRHNDSNQLIYHRLPNHH